GEPSRSRLGRAGRSRRERSPGKGGGTPRQRYSYRAVQVRIDGAPARGRIVAPDSSADRRVAAGDHFAHQNSGGTQYRGAPPAAGRRGSVSRFQDGPG